MLASDSSRTVGIEAIFAFVVSGPTGGAWWIEARNGAGAVHSGTPATANVTIHLSDDVLLRLGSGELQGSEAFMQGLLRVEGDRSKAIFLAQIFGQ